MEFKESIRSKYVDLVSSGDRYIETFKRKDAVGREADDAILARMAAGSDRETAVADYYQTERGKEVDALCRIAVVDHAVAGVMYDRAYMTLRVQLAMGWEES